MGRKVDVEQLVGASEIARRLELSAPQAVHNWRARHPDFPAPVAILDMGMVWYWPDVEEWVRKTGRLGGNDA
jgi:predicted DNA-binding transcriptional regulator AlpA